MSNQASNATVAGAVNCPGIAAMQPSAEAVHIQSIAAAPASELLLAAAGMGKGSCPSKALLPAAGREHRAGRKEPGGQGAHTAATLLCEVISALGTEAPGTEYGWKSLSLKRATNVVLPFCIDLENFMLGKGESIEKCTFPSVQLPGPLSTPQSPASEQNPLARYCTMQLKTSANRGSTQKSVSENTAFPAHSKDSWTGVTEEITQQAQDKAFWLETGISAPLTQMKIPELPRAAIILLLRGFISFL